MRILARPAFANRRTNPYNAQLYGAMAKVSDVSVAEYSNARAWLLPWDVVHVHWPESSFNHNLPGALWMTQNLLAALCAAKRRGASVIWTAHNLRAHERRFPAWEERMWRRFIPLVDGVIALGEGTLAAVRELRPALRDVPGFVVPHGHYRGAYPRGPGRARARERLSLPPNARVVLFAGQIFDYKNVPALVEASRACADPDLRLVIAGRPRTSELGKTIRSASEGDARITLDLRFIPDDCLGDLFDAADLVALPYREILNSGSALLALSFDRPVLMPSLGSAAELRAVVGESWIRDYPGSLSKGVLEDAIGWACSASRPERPSLDRLEWTNLAAETLAAFREVLSRR